MSIKKISVSAMLLSIALIIGVIEAKIPPILYMLPHARLGIANIIVISTLIILGWKYSLLVVVAKSLMVGVFSGNVMSIAYSLPSGLISFICMVILMKCTKISLPALSAFSAVMHNLTQISVAAIIIKTPSIFYYFSYLGIFAIIAGYLIGIITYYAIRYLPRSLYYKIHDEPLPLDENSLN